MVTEEERIREIKLIYQKLHVNFNIVRENPYIIVQIWLKPR